jgi:predicted hydrocarbon binding protein
MNEIENYHYPNKMGRIILLSFEEVLGRRALNSLLNQAGLQALAQEFPPDNLERAFSFEVIGQIQEALEELYGPRGSKGLSLRAGRAAFHHGLREFGPLIRVTDLDFRLSPLDQKLKAGAEIYAEIFNRFTDQQVRVEVCDEYIYWHIDRCPVCWNRHSEVPVCQLAVGLLEESFYWVSGGKTFKVEETSCIARGDSTCTLRIEKQALD